MPLAVQLTAIGTGPLADASSIPLVSLDASSGTPPCWRVYRNQRLPEAEASGLDAGRRPLCAGRDGAGPKPLQGGAGRLQEDRRASSPVDLRSSRTIPDGGVVLPRERVGQGHQG